MSSFLLVVLLGIFLTMAVILIGRASTWSIEKALFFWIWASILLAIVVPGIILRAVQR